MVSCLNGCALRFMFKYFEAADIFRRLSGCPHESNTKRWSFELARYNVLTMEMAKCVNGATITVIPVPSMLLNFVIPRETKFRAPSMYILG